MRWKSASTPLAAVLAATLLISPAAWGQATPEPSSEPTAEPTTEPTAEPVEDAPTEAPEADEVEDDSAPAPKTDAATTTTAREDERPKGSTEVQSAPNGITLSVARKVAPVGARVKVWGKAYPGDKHWVEIVHADTKRRIRGLFTENDGSFEALISVRRNIALQALSGPAKSEWRRVRALPRLKVGMTATRLFGRTGVAGRISPITTGKWVKVKLRRLDGGKFVSRHTVRVRKGGKFRTRFWIKKPGTYRAEAVFSHANWNRATASSAKGTTPLPSLHVGANSRYVKLLEKRLNQLGHHLAGQNWRFGQDTADAVMAFNKLHGRARVGYVTASTWWALARHGRPRPRYSSPDFHIEVDQSRQVLFVVRGGKVRSILHVSTGAASTPTYDGTYQFWGKIAGYSPGRLYYPSYFHGARAIHGWPEVPPYNASHGCVRVPMWAAKWIYRKVDVGDTIRIYH